MLTRQQLLEAIPTALSTVDLAGYGPKQSGKVRELYERAATLVLITTDRISAFDRVLGLIPFKGQVLNQLSAWWFEQTRRYCRQPSDPCARSQCEHRAHCQTIASGGGGAGYITGVTSTSLWTMYAEGERKPYWGITLPDGLHKNPTCCPRL